MNVPQLSRRNILPLAFQVCDLPGNQLQRAGRAREFQDDVLM